MKIRTITVKLIKNLGNYQSKTVEATAIVQQGDDPKVVGQELQAFVYSQLYEAELVNNDVDF